MKTLVVMATNRFYSKTKLAAGSQQHQTQLLGYTACQWDRYFVPQNVFLVITRKAQLTL